MTCTAYHSAFTGIVRCPCKPLRIITYMNILGPVAGEYCARHAIELRRDEARGKIEITSDEPVYGPIPFKGEAPEHQPEITVKDYYGL